MRATLVFNRLVSNMAALINALIIHFRPFSKQMNTEDREGVSLGILRKIRNV